MNNKLAVERVKLVSPRGFCAGVERAIETVEVCLQRYGAPIYVYHEIVHNKHVVEDLQKKGAIFVDTVEEVPVGAVLIFSAHGISPEVRDAADRKGLTAIDATCPLVTKVHREAIKFASDGYSILLVGHDGHQEVVGTMGEAPERIRLVETVADVEQIVVDNPDKVAVITQTTLSIEDTKAVIDAIRTRFPKVVFPPKEDICYATTNRQRAVKELAKQVDLVLVIGSHNSSNSRRLAEVSQACGASAYLIDDVQAIDAAWFDATTRVGITAGASAPERLVQEVVNYFRERGVQSVEEIAVVPENVSFGLPRELKQATAASA